MRIAILGAGSLGMISGALITRGGYDCTLIDVNKAHVDALNEKGAAITGLYEAVIPVKAALPEDAEGVFDVIFLQTKQMYMASALESVKKNIGPDTAVVTLQNGIPEWKVAELIGREHVVGGSVYHGAKYISPGVSELTTEFQAMHTYVGELDGSVTPRVQEIAKILDSAGGGSVTGDIMGIKYTKLAMNATISGMSACLGCTFGEALENYDSMRCMLYITLEAAKVMEAKGLKAVDMERYCPTVANYTFRTEEEMWKVEKDLRAMILLSYDEIASMLQDIQAGRTACEIDDINGQVVRDAKEYGIPTPFNDTVVDVVKKILKKELVPSFDNLKYFTIPALPKC